MIVKGYLVVMNNSEKNLKDIFTVFIPSRRKDVVSDFVKGNGYILDMVKYEVDLDKFTTERENVLDRLEVVTKYYC